MFLLKIKMWLSKIWNGISKINKWFAKQHLKEIRIVHCLDEKSLESLVKIIKEVKK